MRISFRTHTHTECIAFMFRLQQQQKDEGEEEEEGGRISIRITPLTQSACIRAPRFFSFRSFIMWCGIAFIQKQTKMK